MLTRRATRYLAVALLCFAALLLAACGSGGSPAATRAPSPSPSTTVAPPPSAPTSPTPASAAGPPHRDLFDLARRFRGLPANAPRLARTTAYGYRVGSGEDFVLLDLNVPQSYTVHATVRAVTDHAYWFFQDGVSVSQSTLDQVTSDFESKVYPKVTADFGHEWSPGVDSDPRITIFHGDLRGAGGYFSGSDEYPRAVTSRSNEREAVYLQGNVLSSPGPTYNALLAHELQHLVHWNADPDQQSWINEGLSQVAAELMTGGASPWVSMFLRDPDTQLNFWPLADNTTIHYGESEEFFAYLLDQYGGRQNAVQLLRQAPGMAGVNAYLAAFNTDFLHVFADWVAANYLDESSGRYSRVGQSIHVPAQHISPGQNGQDSVHQFASKYLEVSGPGTFAFDGPKTVTVGVPDPGGPYWWSDRGDSIDSRTTREFDLTGVRSATLRFSTWYDTERLWDFAYVAASVDGGKTWKALPGAHTTTDDPTGAEYGPGYTGDSNGWAQEQVDISPYAGKKVLLRFEYVTDDATNLSGFAVRDIEVPEIGFRDGVSSDNGWQAEGFRRITAPLAQHFLVQVIDRSSGTPQVTSVPLDGSNHAQVQLTGPATVVISGTSDETAEETSYSWSLSR